MPRYFWQTVYRKSYIATWPQNALMPRAIRSPSEITKALKCQISWPWANVTLESKGNHWSFQASVKATQTQWDGWPKPSRSKNQGRFWSSVARKASLLHVGCIPLSRVRNKWYIQLTLWESKCINLFSVALLVPVLCPRPPAYQTYKSLLNSTWSMDVEARWQRSTLH